MWKEMILPQFELLSWCLPGGTKKTDENNQDLNEATHK